MGIAIAAAIAAALGLIGPNADAALPGDDNGDGIIMEDESGWNCATMGNLICGPIEPR
ncbi:hypothetical protein [Nocardia sp. IFM 10818]